MDRTTQVTPSAARLTVSLRDIGYDFVAAVADLVDNSVSAGATRIDVDIEFDGPGSWVRISDDGRGMSNNELIEALRFGSRATYTAGDLGRFGLGLKTATLSQARRLTVLSRRTGGSPRIWRQMLDLDLIAELDDWVVVTPDHTDATRAAAGLLGDGTGTVVLWENLDRVLPESRPEGGWARRRLEGLAVKTAQHLAMVFHRYLEGTADREPLSIAVNGSKLQPWNPFAPGEPDTVELPAQSFELQTATAVDTVRLRRWVLPSRDMFSSPGEFERLSGPQKWNRQQGLYIYRSHRLVQWGGWAGLRGIDEHVKLGRAALDFGPDLDSLFAVNVAKMRVGLPAQLRQLLDRPVHELCQRADERYRKTARHSSPRSGHIPENTSGSVPTAGLALRSAAMQAGEGPALARILDIMRASAPDVLAALGL